MREYLAQAKEWDTEVYALAQARARAWGWMAALSTAGTILSVVALVVVLPLKELVPYVIEVDETTGMVQVQRPLSDGVITQSEAITKYFVVSYLNARLGYLYDTAQKDYTTVQKLSSPSVAKAYHREYSPSNPDSPLNKYGPSGTVSAQIRSISFIDEDTITVPIKRVEKTQYGQRESYEVVSMSYRYTLKPASEEDRFINPLGFQVTSYRIDPQIVLD